MDTDKNSTIKTKGKMKSKSEGWETSLLTITIIIHHHHIINQINQKAVPQIININQFTNVQDFIGYLYL